MLVRELVDLFSSYTAVRSSPFTATISRPPRLVGRGNTGGKRRERDRAGKEPREYFRVKFFCDVISAKLA